MKKVFVCVFIVLLACLTSCGVQYPSASSFQDVLSEKLKSLEGMYQSSDDGIFVQQIIETDGNKEDIYIKLLEFLTRTYNDANEVIQVKEKEQGLIVCKGCHKFNVKDFLYGSAIDETPWHIYKAEVKDGKVRVTITLNEMNWYRPASSVLYLGSDSGSYSILDCPPYRNYENNDEHVRKGYVFYYAVSNILNLMKTTKEYLNKTPAYNVDDNW